MTVLEAVARSHSAKKVLLKISQKSHENTCFRVFICIKLQASGLIPIPYILFSRDHNENKAFKALFCVIPAITSQLVFNFLTDLFYLIL